MPNLSPQLNVYTDGANRNTGNYKGGKVKPNDLSAWAYAVFNDENTLIHQDGNALLGATNNQMELTAFANVLKYLVQTNLTQVPIIFNLDSTYVYDPIHDQRLPHWVKANWHNSNGPVIHQDQWEIVYNLLPRFTNYQLKWVKGHKDCQGNNYVDHLANQKMDQFKKQIGK